MANFRRNKPKIRTFARSRNKWKFRKLEEKGCWFYWMNSWPKWHDVIFHTRPRRRYDKACEGLVLKGADADSMTWPEDKKPHKYFW